VPVRGSTTPRRLRIFISRPSDDHGRWYLWQDGAERVEARSEEDATRLARERAQATLAAGGRVDIKLEQVDGRWDPLVP
jgi:hypothetical protein